MKKTAIKIKANNSTNGRERIKYFPLDSEAKRVNDSIIVSRGNEWVSINFNELMGISFNYTCTANNIPVSRSFVFDSMDGSMTAYRESGKFLDYLGGLISIININGTSVTVYKEPSFESERMPDYTDAQVAMIQNDRVANLIRYVLTRIQGNMPDLLEFLKNDKRFNKLFELQERTVTPEIKDYIDASISEVVAEACNLPFENGDKKPLEKNQQ